MLDASVLRAYACLLSTKEETRTLRALAPAWYRSSWLMSREPRKVCPALISPPLARQPSEAAPEEVLCRLPRECLGCLVDEDGPYMPTSTATPWAAGRQVWGTPVPRTPIVAPGPKACSGLASRRSQRSSTEHRGPQKPAALVDAWRLIGRGRLRFPTLP